MKVKNKLFSWLLLVSMVMTLLPQTALPVFAADDESGYAQQTLENVYKYEYENYVIKITENTVLTLKGQNMIMSSASPIQVADGVTLSIVLAAGSDSLICSVASDVDFETVQGKTAGIYVPATATLNIRNADDNTPGKLTVGGGNGGAGIGGGTGYGIDETKKGSSGLKGSDGLPDPWSAGGSASEYTGNVAYEGTRTIRPKILNGSVQLVALPRYNAPKTVSIENGGIGGYSGKYAGGDCGTVRIYGGDITINGGIGAAGIGGGGGARGEKGGDGKAGANGKNQASYRYNWSFASSYNKNDRADYIQIQPGASGGQGGGAGGQGGSGTKGGAGGKVEIFGGDLQIVGGAGAPGVGGGVGGAGGDGGKGGAGGKGGSWTSFQYTKNVRIGGEGGGTGGTGEYGYAGNSGDGADGGTLNVSGGNIIIKGEKGFGYGNEGWTTTEVQNVNTSPITGVTFTSGTIPQGNAVSKTTKGGILMSARTLYMFTPASAGTDVKTGVIHGFGGSGGAGGKRNQQYIPTKGTPGKAGVLNITKTDANVIFIDELGLVSAKNLPNKNGVTLYEYNLEVQDIDSGSPIEGADVTVKDVSGKVIASSKTRTQEEFDELNGLVFRGDLYRYRTGVATLWLPEGTYTLSGTDVQKGGKSLTENHTIHVAANTSGEGGTSTVGIGYTCEVKLNTHDIVTDANGNKYVTFPNAEVVTNADGVNVPENVTALDAAATPMISKITVSTSETSNKIDVSNVSEAATSNNGQIVEWDFGTTAKTKAEIESLLRTIRYPYSENTRVTVVNALSLNGESSENTTTRTVSKLEAYYTYPVVTAGDVQKDTYAEKKEALANGGGYKAQLTTAFKNAVNQKTTYTATSQNKWEAGTALPNPNPNKASYTYDMGEYPIISTSEMFKDMPELEKLDLSEYTLADSVRHMNDMFTATGKTNGEFPAIGLAKDAEAALFNDDTKTGINKANLYFGNITKVEGETQPVYRYGAEATSIDLDTAGIESYTITGSGTTVTLTEAELTSDPYTFDLTQVFSDDDKANATATSLRTTVTIVKVMAQQNIGVEAYFNADMATANPSAAIMRGAWATESDGYVDFYVRDEGNADGKISVENLKKLKVTADLSYGFENVAAFQTGDKADWYKNILESDLAMYVVKGGTETDIATLSSANNPTPVMFAPAVNNSVSETEEKTEVKDTTADNTENEAGSTTDETISDDNAENAESADTADTDENAADEPKAEEATEPNAEEKTENADVSTLSSEDDIALMALTYLDDAEIVTFTDALGNEQKYTKVRVKVSNVLASGIVTFKLSYNTGTDADSGETVYTAINNAEFDVIVPGDVDKDGVIGSLDSEVCTKVSNGAESAEKGRAGQYKFELADVDKDKIIGSLDAETCIRISNGAYQIRK